MHFGWPAFELTTTLSESTCPAVGFHGSALLHPKGGRESYPVALLPR